MVQIVESCAIEAADDIHYIIEDYWLVEGPLLRDHTCCVDLRPLAILDLVAKQIVEPLLARVNATKDKDSFIHHDCRVAISRLWSYSFQSPYLKPELWRETVLVDVIHCIMAVPATDYKHWVIANDCCMTKPVKRLRARRLHLLPLELLLLESASPEIVVAGTTIVPCEYVHGTIIKHYCVISPRIG